jgi:hypothetical protein
MWKKREGRNGEKKDEKEDGEEEIYYTDRAQISGSLGDSVG